MVGAPVLGSNSPRCFNDGLGRVLRETQSESNAVQKAQTGPILAVTPVTARGKSGRLLQRFTPLAHLTPRAARLHDQSLGERMRIRTTVAAVSGGLVLSALAVPAAQADGGGLHKPTAAERFGVSRAAMSAAAADDEVPVISDVKVNGGKSIVFGTTGVKTFAVSLTASHSAGIQDAYIDLWHGKDLAHHDGVFAPNEQNATCTAVSATTSNCKLTITVDAAGSCT